MIEKVYQFTATEEKVIERIVDDENVNINHAVLTTGTGLPVHFSNSNVYLIIVRGTMTAQLGDQAAAEYAAGSIVNVHFNIKMSITNQKEANLEFFIVKAPHPREMGK